MVNLKHDHKNDASNSFTLSQKPCDFVQNYQEYSLNFNFLVNDYLSKILLALTCKQKYYVYFSFCISALSQNNRNFKNSWNTSFWNWLFRFEINCQTIADYRNNINLKTFSQKNLVKYLSDCKKKLRWHTT